MKAFDCVWYKGMRAWVSISTNRLRVIDSDELCTFSPSEVTIVPNQTIFECRDLCYYDGSCGVVQWIDNTTMDIGFAPMGSERTSIQVDASNVRPIFDIFSEVMFRSEIHQDRPRIMLTTDTMYESYGNWFSEVVEVKDTEGKSFLVAIDNIMYARNRRFLTDPQYRPVKNYPTPEALFTLLQTWRADPSDEHYQAIAAFVYGERK